jgi:hypothetical protein
VKVTARARRSGDWWAIDVPEVEGVFTQVKRLEYAAEEAADAVATMLEVDPSSVEVVVDVVLPDEVDDAVASARSLAVAAEQAQAQASAAMRSVVSTLRDAAGFSVRDVGALLGISHQRVAQLENKVPAKKAPAKKVPAKKATTNAANKSGSSNRGHGGADGYRTAAHAAKSTAAGRTLASKPAAKSPTRKAAAKRSTPKR